MDFSDILKEFDAQNRISKQDYAKPRRDDLLKLQQSWINERMSPEILTYEYDLLDRILNRLKAQIEFIELNSMEIQVGSDSDIKITLMIIESEIERVNFLIRSYLRTRLSKIDKYNFFIVNHEESIMKLSDEETTYMQAHIHSITKLYNNLFLGHIDSSLQSLDDSYGTSMIDEPDWDKPVFIHVIGDINDPIIFSSKSEVREETVNLEKNGIFVLRYSSIKRYVQSGDVVLI